MSNTTSAKILTAIKFAELIGRPPQQVYGYIRAKAMPKECIQYVPKGDGGAEQPMIVVDKALAWWNERLEKRQRGTVKVVSDVDQVVQRMTDMLSSSEDPEVKKLADALAKVMASFQAPKQ